jgi:hypothetical protein
MSLVLKGQNSIITDTIYKVGIYKNFEEFKNNNPSVEFDYDVDSIARGYGFLRMAGKVTFYRLIINKEQGKSIGKVFGFCDGKNVYINEFAHQLTPNSEFSKLEYIGNYCYFQDILCTSLLNGSNTNSCYFNSKLLEIQTGKIIYLSKSTLKEVLSDNDELLHEFNNESKKKKKFKEYIIRFQEE